MWRVRAYEEGDEDGILNLLNLEARVPFTRGHWNWRYRDCPFGSLTFVAEHEEEIVGHMGLFIMDIKVGNRIVRGSQASELFVHPNFRRQGMFVAIGKSLMRQARAEKVLLTYGFPDYPAYRGHIKYGWFDVAMVPALVTYLNTYEAIKPKLKTPLVKVRTPMPLVRTLSKVVDRACRKKRQNFPLEELDTIRVSHFDERVDELWNRESKHYNIIVARTQSYCNWRYFDIPDVKYEVFSAERNDLLEGFLVTRIVEGKERKVGYIIDVFSASKNVFLNLVLSAIDYFSLKGVDSVKCLMLKRYRWYKALKEIGFFNFHPKQKLCARVNSTEFLSEYKRASTWYVTYGDSDFI